ncbi:hypothetical protein GCM10027598_02280 [Amycolatopsis oliviviridis]|uniref:DUF3558 domain-containing protein n=1 Tax=Amycolatopsis oliviviridis TaxID=1471590 RepID=A0ABQ3LQR6_9PSEU|nr:DUF3558 domain-containing protein [Amycolatopsis oliviviridis]GHH22163.1 hypothetical protein GCM10017790_43610 [Amycolatopsis oliviviridis]
MRSKATFLTIAALSSMALLGGCSDQKAVTPTPTSVPPSSGLPTNGAPAVASPITNTAQFESDPCAAIPTAEVESVGGKVEHSEQEVMTAGKACAWIFAKGANTVSAGLVAGNKEGLSSLYAQNATGGLTTFKPVEQVSGYPAVVYANGGEGPGTCTLAVGVRNDLVYTVIPRLGSDHPSFSDPCGMATKVAAAAIKNLKGA